MQRLNQIQNVILQKKLNNVVIVKTDVVMGVTDLENIHNNNVGQGYEGTVVRNMNGLYEFGKRSYDCQKIKNRQTTEAKVLSVEEDKSNQGVLTCQLENGIIFKCLMLKEADSGVNLRLYENAGTLVGKHIEVEYEAESDSGSLQKPVGLRVREVDENWESRD